MLRVKIGTWNVEYGRGERNARRLEKLREHDADVWVLTETSDEIDLEEPYKAIRTDRRASGDPPQYWTTIWTRLKCLERIRTGDPDRTVATRLELSPGHGLIIYGTVLPWNNDPGSSKERPSKGWAEFDRVVPEQGSEWAKVRQANPDAMFVVAGDLNQGLGGEHFYGSKRNEALLREQLAGAQLRCLTEHECFPPGDLEYAPIDHVCAAPPEGWTLKSSARGWNKDVDGVQLSDHSGVVVELTLHPAATE